MVGQVDICNMALAELPSAPITSLEDSSLEARECKRVYAQCFAEMLSWQDWGFATRTVILVLGTNDRTGEWRFAYAAPADMDKAHRIIPGWLFGTDVRHWEGQVFDAMPPEPFVIENGLIYANAKDARLEYGVDTVSEAALPPLLVRALVLEIASRIAMPIKKDMDLKKLLIQQAEAAKVRAMADEQNRQPTIDEVYFSETALARAGEYPDHRLVGW